MNIELFQTEKKNYNNNSDCKYNERNDCLSYVIYSNDTGVCHLTFYFYCSTLLGKLFLCSECNRLSENIKMSLNSAYAAQDKGFQIIESQNWIFYGVCV